MRKQVSLYYPRLLGAYEAYVRWVGDMKQDQVNILNNQMPGVMPPVFGSMKKII
ncbi:lambdoid prophage Rac integrase [Enterobacter cloacae]|nr:lambdoid prophage Rac integrase [Enterobacter cloacae]